MTSPDSIGQDQPHRTEDPLLRGGGAQSQRRTAVDLEVIIPAYNEAQRLPATLSNAIDSLRAQAWSSRIVAVDIGSADDTASVVRRISSSNCGVPIALIGCSRPGTGAAVRRGLLSGASTYTGFFYSDLATPLAWKRPQASEDILLKIGEIK